MTNEEQDIVWEGYGLKLHIPSNSLPEGRSQCQLKVEVGLSGEFELPENGVLGSAVYSISHDLGDEKLRQPITLRMEHCASDLDHLHFVKADIISNKFEIIRKGNFIFIKGFGEIKLFNFSRFAIIQFLREHFSFLFTPYDYCCKVFYTSILYHCFNMEVCVFRQLEVVAKVSSSEIDTPNLIMHGL